MQGKESKKVGETIVETELTEKDWQKILAVLKTRPQSAAAVKKLKDCGNRPTRAEELFAAAHGGGYSRFYQLNRWLEESRLPYRLKTNDGGQEEWFGNKPINIGVVLNKPAC